MLSPLRIIFSDTCTGETGWVDVPEAEFSIESVIKAITTAMGGDDEPHEPLTSVCWALEPVEPARIPRTACFLIAMQPYLIHGVCYTQFIEGHNPLK